MKRCKNTGKQATAQPGGILRYLRDGLEVFLKHDGGSDLVGIAFYPAVLFLHAHFNHGTGGHFRGKTFINGFDGDSGKFFG